MNQFTFTSRQKTTTFIMMAIGVVRMILTWFQDDALHTRFWTNFLHNSVFFTGIAFMALFGLCAAILTYAGWFVVFKRLWEAYSLFLIVGLVLLVVIIGGVWAHYHHLYHWADLEAVKHDEILANKSAFLNPMWYTLGTLICVGAWYYFATKLRKLSADEDLHGTNDYEQYRKSKIFAAIFLPIGGFTSAALIWQWLMSLDAHWYSTMYAWYATASWFVSMLCLTVLMVIWLKGKGYMEFVSREHLHDLGKFVFAFSIFWTYLWFSQFMLIWYSNNGEETTYFNQRMLHYPVLFWGNLVLNFLLPFLILIRNDTKRKVGIMAFVAMIVFFGHWLDFFQMVKPGALHTATEALGHATGHGAAAAHGAEAAGHGATASGLTGSNAPLPFKMGFTIPGLLEIGTLVGFLGLFFYFTLNQLAKVSLVAKNDPFLHESIHHHV